MVRGRRSLELRTERLVIRVLARTDVTEFVRYRNLAAVSAYQDWPLPYTRDHAHALVDEMEELAGPTPDRWVQLALEHHGALVGDAAVWLDESGALAMVGYTLAPEHQGRGYAVEATAAIVDWLFSRRRVHRVAATIDPRNLASARVLEHCGFEYIGTARSSAMVRGEWTDDARFSLLADDWKAWTRRPRGRPKRVELVEVTHENVRAVGALDRAFSQRSLVAPVLVSLAEALVPPVIDGVPLTPWYRAVTADRTLVGFVMVELAGAAGPDPFLWRLLVDHRHQGRGIGSLVVREVARDQRERGASRLLVSYVPDLPGNPARFYRALGFVETGRIDESGEVEAALDLT